MADTAKGTGSGPVLPPLAGEDHVCKDCALSYSQVSVERAGEVIHAVRTAVRAAVAGIPSRLRPRRPSAGVWSVTEYVVHLRDVYATSTIRLYRARTEDLPVLEPMLNNLRAASFGYNERDLECVLAEIDRLTSAAPPA